MEAVNSTNILQDKCFVRTHDKSVTLTEDGQYQIYLIFNSSKEQFLDIFFEMQVRFCWNSHNISVFCAFIGQALGAVGEPWISQLKYGPAIKESDMYFNAL